MRFKIDFTTVPSIEVEIDIEHVEAFARQYCEQHGYDPNTGDGPMPLQIQRIDLKSPSENPERCKNCGYPEIWLSHNTRTYYCIQCDSWIDEDEEK